VGSVSSAPMLTTPVSLARLRMLLPASPPALAFPLAPILLGQPSPLRLGIVVCMAQPSPSPGSRPGMDRWPRSEGAGANRSRGAEPPRRIVCRQVAPGARKIDPDLPHLTPHDLRHTAASLTVSADANVKAVQRMLGRASAAMTLDSYAASSTTTSTTSRKPSARPETCSGRSRSPGTTRRRDAASCDRARSQRPRSLTPRRSLRASSAGLEKDIPSRLFLTERFQATQKPRGPCVSTGARGSKLAVTVGFEPTVGGYPTQLFESCTFGRSDTSPQTSVRDAGRTRQSSSIPLSPPGTSRSDSRRGQRRPPSPPPPRGRHPAGC